MRSKFSLARTLALALVAIGTVACVSSETFAANRTWTPVTSGSTAARWGTASVYAANWSGGITNPTAADSAIFNANSARQITPILNNLLPIGDINVTGSGNVTFLNTTGARIVISGNGGAPNVGVNVSGAGNAIFNGNTVVNAPQMTFQATGAGQMIFGGGGLDLQGNYLKVVGNATQSSLGSSTANATYEAVSGVQTLTFDSTLGVNVNVVVNGGTVSGDGTSDSSLTVSGGDYVGGGTYKNVVSSSGSIQLLANETLSTTSFTQSAGGELMINVNDDLSSATVNGNYQLGGAFELDANNLGTNLYSAGTTWGLFFGRELHGRESFAGEWFV